MMSLLCYTEYGQDSSLGPVTPFGAAWHIHWAKESMTGQALSSAAVQCLCGTPAMCVTAAHLRVLPAQHCFVAVVCCCNGIQRHGFDPMHRERQLLHVTAAAAAA